jgi:hypothetical protein
VIDECRTHGDHRLVRGGARLIRRACSCAASDAAFADIVLVPTEQRLTTCEVTSEFDD